ncbi:hypothetical protein HELRODRAFT_170232 [Helobdella robusta]|uniref:Uncharacterized protein n=1 Tax=Helobdella robusta TaxID=6412 RepID=T1F2T2_HELRO|nr:hypothetical protein HELRODRAFT_170232 [Helobdella robusta]ESO07697.1 hypothetical protein HELRODRAFT_170232 [Helobdella robusta]
MKTKGTYHNNNHNNLHNGHRRHRTIQVRRTRLLWSFDTLLRAAEKERVSDEWDPNSRTPSYPDFSQQARNKSLRTYSCPYILEQKVAIMLRCISDQFCAQHWVNNAAALEYNETRRRRSCSLTVENKVRQGRMLDDRLLQQHIGQMDQQKRRGSGRRRDIATPLPSTFNIDDIDFDDEDDDDESPNLQNLKIYKMLVEEFSGEGTPVDTDVVADVPQPTTAISFTMQQPSIPTFSSSSTVSPSSSQSYLEMKSSIDERQRSVAPETLKIDTTECHWPSSSSSFFSSLATSFPAVNMPSSSSSQSKSSSPLLTLSIKSTTTTTASNVVVAMYRSSPNLHPAFRSNS